jgi:hypothetical protein
MYRNYEAQQLLVQMSGLANGWVKLSKYYVIIGFSFITFTVLPGLDCGG